jgi:serine/threonine protein phosphatase PrpC
VYSDIGTKRKEMEDRTLLVEYGIWRLYSLSGHNEALKNPVFRYAVFDGHGGKDVADELYEHYPSALFDQRIFRTCLFEHP